MKLYFAAFIGTFFLALMLGIAGEAIVLGVLEFASAPKTLELWVGGLALVPLLGFFSWHYPQVLEVERDISLGSSES